MNTALVPGLSSEVRAATGPDAYDLDFTDSLLVAVREYVRRCRDYKADAVSAYTTILQEVMSENPDTMLFVHMSAGKVMGFMHCRVSEENREEAIINQGFAVPETPRAAVDKAMELFEKWAKSKGCKTARFYTFRVPGAHRLMTSRGYEHVMTQYKKEL